MKTSIDWQFLQHIVFIDYFIAVILPRQPRHAAYIAKSIADKIGDILSINLKLLNSVIFRLSGVQYWLFTGAKTWPC